MKNIKKAQIISIVFALFLSTPVMALPTSGFWIPSAESIEPSFLKIDIQQDYALFDKKENQTNHFSSVGAVMGVYTNDSINAEVSVDYIEPVGKDTVDSINFAGKIQYKHKKSDLWKLAFGLRRFSFSSDTNARILYGVSDIKVLKDDIARVGLYSGNSKVLVDSKGSSSETGFMFGYYRKMKSEWGRVGVEWVSGKNAFSYMSFGTHFRFTDTVNCMVAYAIPNDTSFRQKLLLRVSMFY